MSIGQQQAHFAQVRVARIVQIAIRAPIAWTALGATIARTVVG